MSVKKLAGARDLDPLTVNWERVTRESPELGRRFLQVMAEMSQHYAEGDWREPYEIMIGDTGRYYVGSCDRGQIVAGYLWNPDHAMYQLRSVGFVGQIGPQQAMALISSHLHEFLAESGLSQVYVILPPSLDSPAMMQFCGLVPWLTDWKVSGGRYVEGGIYWRIEAL